MAQDVQPFNFRSGVVDSSSVIISVYSLSSSAASVVIGGNTIIVTMVGVGTDGVGGAVDSGDAGAPAMYVGTITVSGLSGWSPFTVTQNAITINGLTTPDQGDVKQEIYCITCDNKNSESGGKGSWPAMRTFAELPGSNVTLIVHTDDHGYGDSNQVDDTNGSGLFLSGVPQGLKTVYSYTLAYAAYLGLIAGDEQNVGYYPDFQDPDRIWCWRNIPIWTQVGDHEVSNNPEENGDRTAANLANAMEAFDNTVGSTTPRINKANSLAYVNNVGPLEIISYDRLSALPAMTSLYNPSLFENNAANNIWLGQPQIDDIKGAMTGNNFFILVSASAGIKGIAGPNWSFSESLSGWTQSDLGSQQPIHDYTSDLVKSDGDDAHAATSEMLTLFTLKSTPPSICQLAEQKNKTVIMHHGDTHVPRINHHYLPQSSSHSEMDLLEIGSGAVCLKASHRHHPIFEPGYAYQGANVIWNAPWTIRNTSDSTSTNVTSSYLRLECEAGGNVVAKIIKAEIITADDVIKTHTYKRKSGSNGPNYLRGGSL